MLSICCISFQTSFYICINIHNYACLNSMVLSVFITALHMLSCNLLVLLITNYLGTLLFISIYKCMSFKLLFDFSILWIFPNLYYHSTELFYTLKLKFTFLAYRERKHRWLKSTSSSCPRMCKNPQIWLYMMSLEVCYFFK